MPQTISRPPHMKGAKSKARSREPRNKKRYDAIKKFVAYETRVGYRETDEGNFDYTNKERVKETVFTPDYVYGRKSFNQTEKENDEYLEQLSKGMSIPAQEYNEEVPFPHDLLQRVVRGMNEQKSDS